MNKVEIDRIDDPKTLMVVSVQPAAALSVNAGDLIIAVGTNVSDRNNQDVITALGDLKDALRERQYPHGAQIDNYAYFNPLESKSSIVIGNGLSIPALTEDDVVIAYENGFYPAGNSVQYDQSIQAMTEKLMEVVLKFN